MEGIQGCPWLTDMDEFDDLLELDAAADEEEDGQGRREEAPDEPRGSLQHPFGFMLRNAVGRQRGEVKLDGEWSRGESRTDEAEQSVL